MIARALTQITFAILFTGNLFAQDTLPNPDFEQWISSTVPKNWSSTNSLLPAGNIVCFRTSNSYSGDFAVQLKTIDLEGMPVPGVLTLGYVGMGYTAGGIGFTQKPVSLKGFVRHPSSGDQVMVIAQFFKNGNQIGNGFWSTTDSIAEYTEFVVPISFQSMEAPDTLNITIVTDQGQIGSSMQIDALEFEYLPTSTNEEKKLEKVYIFPVPCKNHLRISSPENQPENISVYDLSGRLVVNKPVNFNGEINVSSLPPGIYVAHILFSNGAHRQKFIKE